MCAPASLRRSQSTPRCRPRARCATARAAPAACRHNCWAAGTTPAASRTTRREQRADRVLPSRDLRGHIVGLIDHALAIVGPSRRQHLVAHALAIQEHLVCAQRRGIKPRGFHRRADRELVPQRLHRVGNPRIAQRFRAVAAQAAARPPLPSIRIVEVLLLPAVGRVNGSLPVACSQSLPRFRPCIRPRALRSSAARRRSPCRWDSRRNAALQWRWCSRLRPGPVVTSARTNFFHGICL